MTLFVQVETNLWDTDEARLLGDELNDPDAWRFVIRLWAWGIESGLEHGICRLPPRRIKEICGYKGRANRLFFALKASNFLQEISEKNPLWDDKLDRKQPGCYMRGWSRVQKFFKERRKDRERKRETRRKNTTQMSGGHPPVKIKSKINSKIYPDQDQLKGVVNVDLNASELTTIAEFQSWCANRGLCVELTMDERQKASRLIRGGPIQRHELAEIVERAKSARRPPSYLLSAVEANRKRFADDGSSSAPPVPNPKNPRWREPPPEYMQDFDPTAEPPK